MKDLNNPWMVVAFPGSGYAALNAGFYLIGELQMDWLSDLEARDLLGTESLQIEAGVIEVGRTVRSRFFTWKDPLGQRDLVVFIGHTPHQEADLAYCDRLISHGSTLGVERVIGLEALPCEARHCEESPIRIAATDRATAAECERLGLPLMQSGEIDGVNGALIRSAAEGGIQSTCLLTEVPGDSIGLYYPKASLAILRAFSTLGGLPIDLSALEEEVELMNRTDKILLTRIDEALSTDGGLEGRRSGSGSFGTVGRGEPAGPGRRERRLIENLFSVVAEDRSQAPRLKRELDRLRLFGEYEDRFLSLFRPTGARRSPGPKAEKPNGDEG